MALITILHGSVDAKLQNAPKEVKLAVQELLSYRLDGAPLAMQDKWSGRSSFFDFPTEKFPRGFLTVVQARLVQLGHKVQVIKKPYPEPLGPEFPIVDEFGEDPRYAYQRHVVDKVLTHGQIIAQVATGGGKSRIAKLVYSRIKRPTLFLTTRGILMYQMADAMKKLLGENNVGIFGDSNWRYVDGFNVGMVQTFAAALKEPDPMLTVAEQSARYREIAKVKEILSRFELVIMEEAHEASGNSYFDIMRLCVNAHYRLSLTGTPFMKDSEEANMRLMASSGPVAIKITEEQLINSGILAKPYFKFVRLDDPMPQGLIERRDAKGKKTGDMMAVPVVRSQPWPKCYEVGIVGGLKRNGVIVYEAKRAAEYGLPVIVLIQQTAHGQTLQRMMTDAGVRCVFIHGEHDQNERKAALIALAEGRIDVLIGSTILDVGVDVPAVGMVILAGGGKAEVANRQRIGRGLRGKTNMPNVCFVLDFDDWQANHLRDHSRQRRAIIEGTPGFCEGILEPGKDFDFAGFGLIRK